MNREPELAGGIQLGLCHHARTHVQVRQCMHAHMISRSYRVWVVLTSPSTGTSL